MIQEIFQSVEEVNVVYQYIVVFIIGIVPFLEAFVDCGGLECGGFDRDCGSCTIFGIVSFFCYKYKYK